MGTEIVIPETSLITEDFSAYKSFEVPYSQDLILEVS
jgi:hypothetical protein